MKRLRITVFLAAAVVALALLAIVAGTARADPAIHFKETFTFDFILPAGNLCDFNYEGKSTQVYIVTASTPATPNGVVVVHETEYNTHINLDTGYTLTETDEVVSQFPTTPFDSATLIQVGLFWHLRDASGNIVLVKAGTVTFDAATGEVISFTPNSGFDQTFAEIICTALGGSPA
jgi:hypothetical protein